MRSGAIALAIFASIATATLSAPAPAELVPREQVPAPVLATAQVLAPDGFRFVSRELDQGRVIYRVLYIDRAGVRRMLILSPEGELLGRTNW